MNKPMTGKTWFRAALGLLLALMIAIMAVTVVLDPFFHYHAPLPGFSYVLNNERSQNDGILRHFDFDAVITGTSMTENFKTSQLDSLFGVKAAKIVFSGATFKETADCLDKAYRYRDVKLVVRALDYPQMLMGEDAMRFDLGEYPEYLYNSNPFDDVQYLLNLNVLTQYDFPLLLRKIKGEPGGITSFDDYANWMSEARFGKKYALQKDDKYEQNVPQEELTEEDRELVLSNIRQNVTRIAKEHPETEFYYFFPPYSIVWWSNQYAEGQAKRMLEAEELSIREMLPCENIRVFSWNTQVAIISNLDNYRDRSHYGEWINEQILQDMRDGAHEITSGNVDTYVDEEQKLFLESNYELLPYIYEIDWDKWDQED